MPEYVPGERLRVAVEGVVAPTPQSGETPTPGELTITLDLPGGPYDVTVPMAAIAVTVERLIPAGGEPRPNEIWRDATGVDRWAYRDSQSGEVCLTDAAGVRNQWSHFNVMYGPITRVYQPAGQTGQTGEPVLTLGDRYRDRDDDIWTVAEEHGQLGLKFDGTWDTWAGANADYGPLTPITAERTGEPRVMLGDLWEDGDGDIWKVVTNFVGEHRLKLGQGGSLYTWAEVSSDYEPLMLVQRAGYRRTEDTVPAGRLNIGMVVSCPGWRSGAPARVLGLHADGKATYELIGDPAINARGVLLDAVFTVWEPTGGAS